MAPGPWHVGQVFVNLDRGLSPAGTLHFKNLRLAGRASSEPWPNPGVTTVPELSGRILRALERRFQKRLTPRETLSPLAAIRYLSEGGAGLGTRDPLHALESYREALRLAPLGLKFQDARGFLDEIEGENTDPELKADSERLLNFFALKAHAADRNAALTPWCLVERTLEILESAGESLSALAWNEILERPTAATPELVVPLLCEPQALEERWLRSLRRFVQVTVLAPPEVTSELAPLPSLDVATLTGGDFSIHWARRETPPGALEVLELLPGEFAIDVPEPPPPTSREELRRLYLYARYFEEHEPTHHPYLRLPSRTFPEEFSADVVRARLAEIFAEAEARELDPPPEARWSSWVRVLEACLSGATDGTPPPPHPRQSPGGVPWLTPADLGFAGVSNQILWASRDELEELCDPVSSVRVARESLSPRLKELLKASGYAVPDPGREARLFRGVLEAQVETLRLPKASHLATPVRQTAPKLRVQTPTLTTALSPSAIESYLSCAFRYYADRMLKLRDSEEWDPSTENALKLGRWTHKALELAFDQGRDAASLEASLKSNLDEFYPMVTPAYRRVLEARAEGLARELEIHMVSFESALEDWREGRPLTERRVSGAFGNIPLTGIIDRVDLLREGGTLIWDYKTGDVREKNLEAQLKHGRVQWLLYRHILEKNLEGGAERPCWGGGYLNPLKPSRSALFLVEDGNPLFERLLLVFQNAGHPVQVLRRASLEAAETELADIVAQVLENIALGVFTARPRRDQDCNTCAHLALCGRPYLMEIRR